MKLIIDIPNDLYNKYKNDNNIDDIHKWNILSFIRKGIPLEAEEALYKRIKNAPTIIEADKAEGSEDR